MILFSERLVTNLCGTTVEHASARMCARNNTRQESAQLNLTADLTATPVNSDSPFKRRVCQERKVRTTGAGKQRLCSVKEPRRLAAARPVIGTEQTHASAKGSSAGWKSTKGKQGGVIFAAAFRCY